MFCNDKAESESETVDYFDWVRKKTKDKTLDARHAIASYKDPVTDVTTLLYAPEVARVMHALDACTNDGSVKHAKV